MKKHFFIAFVVALFLIVPVSVYAYSYNVIPLSTSFNYETTTDETSFNSNNMMGYNYMSDMLNNSFMFEMMKRNNMEVCTDPEQHKQFIKEQKLIIELQLHYMDYYNNDRYQWGLAKLSPNQYAEYLKDGEYPLKV